MSTPNEVKGKLWLIPVIRKWGILAKEVYEKWFFVLKTFIKI